MVNRQKKGRYETLNIYELTDQYRLLEQAMLLNPESEELEAEFSKISDSIENKADNYAKIIKNFEADMNAIDNEIERLKERKSMFKNNISRMKENLMWSMKETGRTKFKTELFSFGVVKNGGKAPLKMMVKPEELPEELTTVTVSANNDAIRKYIEETGDLTYAYIEDRGEHLNIR